MEERICERDEFLVWSEKCYKVEYADNFAGFRRFWRQ